MHSETPERIVRNVVRGAGILMATMATAALALVPATCDTGNAASLASDYLPRYAHQSYGHSLAQSRLFQTLPARAWRGAAERALLAPDKVTLPLRLEGEFDPAAPGALGVAFDVAQARRVRVSLTARDLGAADVFVDLFAAGSSRLEHAASAAPRASNDTDVLSRSLELEVQEPSSYVLRIQPELLAAGRYALEIDVEPILAFPVDGYDTRAIQSVFGAERDGGRRAHRGVDIFAARGTAALASVDAWVARVDTTPRGGNVVWLQPLFGDMRLYYAHLDSQLVETGQFVRAGEVVGTVGNTGNAITTPPHLHFGVYLRRQGRRGGARDPYFFLN